MIKEFIPLPLTYRQTDSVVKTLRGRTQRIGVAEPRLTSMDNGIFQQLPQTPLDDETFSSLSRNLFQSVHQYLTEKSYVYRYILSDDQHEPTQAIGIHVQKDNHVYEITMDPNFMFSLKFTDRNNPDIAITTTIDQNPPAIRYQSGLLKYADNLQALEGTQAIIKQFMKDFQKRPDLHSQVNDDPFVEFAKIIQNEFFHDEKGRFDPIKKRQAQFDLLLMYYFHKSGALDRLLQRNLAVRPLSEAEFAMGFDAVISRRELLLTERFLHKMNHRYREPIPTRLSITTGWEYEYMQQDSRKKIQSKVFRNHAKAQGIPIEQMMDMVNFIIKENKTYEESSQVLEKVKAIDYWKLIRSLKVELQNPKLAQLAQTRLFGHEEASHRHVGLGSFITSPEVTMKPAINPAIPRIETLILIKLGLLDEIIKPQYTVGGVRLRRRETQPTRITELAVGSGRIPIPLSPKTLQKMRRGDVFYSETLPKRSPNSESEEYVAFHKWRKYPENRAHPQKGLQPYPHHTNTGVEFRIFPRLGREHTLIPIHEGNVYKLDKNHWFHQLTPTAHSLYLEMLAVKAVQRPRRRRNNTEEALAAVYKQTEKAWANALTNQGIENLPSTRRIIRVDEDNFEVRRKTIATPLDEVITDVLLAKHDSQSFANTASQLADSFDKQVVTILQAVR